MSNLLLRPNHRILYIAEGEYVNQIFTVSDDSISLKTVVTVDEQEHKVLDVVLSLETLRSWTELDSNMVVGFTLYGYEDFTAPFSLTDKHLLNMSRATAPQRIKDSFSSRVGLQSNLQFVVNNPNGNFEDFNYVLSTPQENFTLETNSDYSTISDPRSFDILQFLDTIQVSKDLSYDNAEYDKFIVTSAAHVPTVYVQQVIGILDRTRVELTNGSGSFRVLKNSLESGEKVKARVGFKYYEAMNKFTDQ